MIKIQINKLDNQQDLSVCYLHKKHFSRMVGTSLGKKMYSKKINVRKNRDRNTKCISNQIKIKLPEIFINSSVH